MIALRPLWLFWVGLSMVLIAIDRRLLWGHQRIADERIYFWTIVITAAVVLILNMESSPGR